MSYDLMVFDPAAPPSNRRDFMIWFERQTEWTEGHGYQDPKVTTPALRAWFMDIIAHFPAMNGPYALDDDNHPRLTDYSIGEHVIYAAFPWSAAMEAYPAAIALAERHRVGFFDASDEDGGVWLPDASGGFTCVHGRRSKAAKRFWEFWKSE